MLTEDTKNKLKETLANCDLHYQRMMFAFNSVEKYFPLTEFNFSQVSPIELALFDQLIYRFSKLQDNMGSRLFKQLLELLEEDISGLPFLDILYKMEKLNLVESAKDWITLRQTRNTVSHEYPFYKEIQIEELNLLPEEVEKLAGIWLKLKEYALKRLTAESEE
jgi:hypothetical protein